MQQASQRSENDEKRQKIISGVPPNSAQVFSVISATFFIFSVS
jgi:hypothetical protein